MSLFGAEHVDSALKGVVLRVSETKDRNPAEPLALLELGAALEAYNMPGTGLAIAAVAAAAAAAEGSDCLDLPNHYLC